MTDNRPRCIKPGCNNKAKTHHKRKDGSWSYKKLCQKHHNEKYGIVFKKKPYGRFLIPAKECIVCGWNGPCDRHRVITSSSKSVGYTKDNIRVLCPNCHRLVHHGLLLVE